MNGGIQSDLSRSLSHPIQRSFPRQLRSGCWGWGLVGFFYFLTSLHRSVSPTALRARPGRGDRVEGEGEEPQKTVTAGLSGVAGIWPEATAAMPQPSPLSLRPPVDFQQPPLLLAKKTSGRGDAPSSSCRFPHSPQSQADTFGSGHRPWQAGGLGLVLATGFVPHAIPEHPQESCFFARKP